MARLVDTPLLNRAATWLNKCDARFRKNLLWHRIAHPILKLLLVTVREFIQDHCLDRSEALAFTTILTSIPLAALLLFLFKRLMSEQFVQLQTFILTSFMPNANQQAAGRLLAMVSEHIDLIGQGLPGLIALLVLVWGSLALLSSAERSLNHIWELDKGRHIGQRLIQFIGYLFSGIVVVALLAYIEGPLRGIGMGAGILGALFAWLRPFAVFMIIFKFVPNIPVKTSAAATGALLSSLLWMAMRQGIDIYIFQTFSHSPIAKVYGSLALFPITLIFIWLTWLLVLAGAELSFSMQNLDELYARWSHRRVEQDALLRFALFQEICRAYVQDDREKPSAGDLARRFNLQKTLGEEIAGDLAAMGLVAITDPDSRSRRYVPANDATSMNAGKVLKKLLNQSAGHERGADPQVAALYFRAYNALEAEFGRHTMADLVQKSNLSIMAGSS